MGLKAGESLWRQVLLQVFLLENQGSSLIARAPLPNSKTMTAKFKVSYTSKFLGTNFRAAMNRAVLAERQSINSPRRFICSYAIVRYEKPKPGLGFCRVAPWRAPAKLSVEATRSLVWKVDAVKGGGGRLA